MILKHSLGFFHVELVDEECKCGWWSCSAADRRLYEHKLRNSIQSSIGPRTPSVTSNDRSYEHWLTESSSYLNLYNPCRCHRISLGNDKLYSVCTRTSLLCGNKSSCYRGRNILVVCTFDNFSIFCTHVKLIRSAAGENGFAMLEV